ncbi:MAG TPA: hypothetical protein EYP60_01720, partial [bacterium (Candidatus Stahlbacteria)]|nr:hypothetical protein [Candidatus Stahlbacteria bacterium]
MRKGKRRVRLLPYGNCLTQRTIPIILYLLLILGMWSVSSSAYANNTLKSSPSSIGTDTICPGEDIDITHRPVIGVGHHGTTVTTSPFVVWNTKGCCNPDATDGPGEDTDLDNLQILCTDLVGDIHNVDANNVIFDPNVISELESGDSTEVRTYVYVPLGTHSGEYRGTITVVDDDGCPSDTAGIIITVLPSYDLDIDDNGANLKDNTMNLASKLGSVVQASFKLINPNSQLFNVDPDPFGNAKLTSLNYSSSALICGTDTMPSNLVTFLNMPDTLESGVSANVTIRVTIPEDQPKGLYTGTVTVIDTEIVDNDTIVVSDSFILKVDVGVVIEDIDITSYAAGIGYHGTCITTSPFIVWNTDATNNPDTSDGPGNTDLDNLQITSTKLLGCTYPLNHYILTSNITFEPDAISYLESGDSTSVRVNVCIPPGTYADCYEGVITVRDDDGYPLAVTDIEIT